MAFTVNPFATGIASAIASISLHDGFYFRIVLYFVLVLVAIIYVCAYASKIKRIPQSRLCILKKMNIMNILLKKMRFLLEIMLKIFLNLLLLIN